MQEADRAGRQAHAIGAAADDVVAKRPRLGQSYQMAALADSAAAAASTGAGAAQVAVMAPAAPIVAPLPAPPVVQHGELLLHAATASVQTSSRLHP